MKPIKVCRACQSERLVQFLDLGKQYLSDFREDYIKPPKYPLVAVICESCKLVQLKHTTPQIEMYHDRYGFKSGINDSIKADLDSIVTHAFQYNSDPHNWLDIASNDGTLLSFVPADVYRVGVDPVTFLCIEAEQHADVIVNDFFDGDSLGGEFDVITSVSCFYDMPDPSQFVKDVKQVLAKHGVWIIQQNYLLTTMELSAVDNFCHEHLEYYTLFSLEKLLERFGLEVNEVQTSMVNGGSIRTVVSHKGTFNIDGSVDEQRYKEMEFGITTLAPYKRFAEKVGQELTALKRLVNELNAQGKRVAIIAASTRGSTIWQSAELTSEDIVYAVERNPAKVGKIFSAIDIPIVSEKFAHEDNPEYMLVGPWFFAFPEIVQREREYIIGGGSLIIPLPKVEIINLENYRETAS